jgi:hypothetical protein
MMAFCLRACNLETWFPSKEMNYYENSSLKYCSCKRKMAATDEESVVN